MCIVECFGIHNLPMMKDIVADVSIVLIVPSFQALSLRSQENLIIASSILIHVWERDSTH